MRAVIILYQSDVFPLPAVGRFSQSILQAALQKALSGAGVLVCPYEAPEDVHVDGSLVYNHKFLKCIIVSCIFCSVSVCMSVGVG